MFSSRALVAAVAGMAVLLGAADVFADGASDLEKAHNAYIAHQYDEAEARLRSLLDPTTGTLKDPDSIADARMYLGATFVAEKKMEQAAAIFAVLLNDDPEYQPDALRVSLEAIDAFTEARARNRDRLLAVQAERVRKAQEEKERADAEHRKEALRIAMLEKLAATEVVTERHSRLVALLPFGAGQFQNGQTTLAWSLLVGQGLLSLGSGIGAAAYWYNIGQRDAVYATEPSVANQYNKRAQEAAIVGDVLAGAFAVVAIAGVIHAEATFVPEVKSTRKRDLPVPSLSPVVGLAGIGLRGTF